MIINIFNLQVGREKKKQFSFLDEESPSYIIIMSSKEGRKKEIIIRKNKVPCNRSIEYSKNDC